MLQLLEQQGAIEVLANQHQLIFGLPLPEVILKGKSLTRQMENMSLFAFLKPQNALSPKDFTGQLII